MFLELFNTIHLLKSYIHMYIYIFFKHSFRRGTGRNKHLALVTLLYLHFLLLLNYLEYLRN